MAISRSARKISTIQRHTSAVATDTVQNIAGPTDADKNLGLKYFLKGTLMSDMLDTNHVATDTIDYVATDPSGLTATSTRTVIIEAAVPPSPPPPVATSTTQ